MRDTHREAGYTLLSLLLGLTLLGIMLPTALHQFAHWRDARVVHQTAHALEQLIQQGIGHSMMTRQALRLCGDTDEAVCVPRWQQRIVVRSHAESPPLAVLTPPTELKVYGPHHLLYFQPMPFAHQASATFTLCGQYTAVRLIINRTGRLRQVNVDQQACSPHT